eukprot:CAMPEP_0115200614 /NCGR_PEP_ID=MMETSP0270-20121206/17210_1 /TAXON_ID=71861 /ORGANISM="Scrippsiella trochoidea, Strain CCMP3099" /LENGTH=572 /DNA_ID=CAMNT_0002614019 /DNA_START=135 /DNA_END=1854 /DNA_ORIENTATION=-
MTMPEIPAGMVDGSGNFSGAAAKELKEETGIEIHEKDLIDMTDLAFGDAYPGMYPSCGASDEFNRLFMYRQDVTAAELESLQGRLTGVAEEGEHIKLQIIPLGDLWKMSPDAKALGALCLYRRLFTSKKHYDHIWNRISGLQRVTTTGTPSRSEQLMPAHGAGADPSVQLGGTSVPVTGEPGIDVALAMSFVPFQDWVREVGAHVSAGRAKVSKVHIQSVDFFGPKVGFMKFKADVTVDGKFVPGIVFSRGGSVAILVILIHEGTPYTVLVRQPRVAVGNMTMPEIPAGMVDGSGNFSGAAAKELKEETGIEIHEKDLIDMTDLAFGDAYPGMYPSCGASDEFNRLFMYRQDVTAAELESLQGRLTGVAEEGEHIKLQIIPLGDLWKMSPDAKALGALCLLNQLTDSETDDDDVGSRVLQVPTTGTPSYAKQKDASDMPEKGAGADPSVQPDGTSVPFTGGPGIDAPSARSFARRMVAAFSPTSSTHNGQTDAAAGGRCWRGSNSALCAFGGGLAASGLHRQASDCREARAGALAWSCVGDRLTQEWADASLAVQAQINDRSRWRSCVEFEV